MDVEARVAAHLAARDFAAAATAAVESYGPAIFGYLCTLLDDDEARDVFSQWAEDLWRGLPGFRRECTLRAWAYRLAWHAAARYRRDPYRARGERLPSSAASRLAASLAASSMMPGGRRERLRKLRASLPPEDQTLLMLRIDKELTWEEIASVLAAPADGDPSTGDRPDGDPPATAVNPVALRKRYERLKDRLAQQARDEGLLD